VSKDDVAVIDIHSHFLPGLDDGAEDIETSVAMIEMAAADGTTHLVGTPHCNANYAFSLQRNQELLEELRARTKNRITLLCGCDFHLSYENIQAVLADKSPYTLNQGDYLLTEFSDYSIAPQTRDIFHQMRLKGITPIVTHPERNPLLQHGPGPRLLRQLVEMGCPIQVTAGSLTGRFGRRAQEFSEQLIAQQMVHFLASDAHDTKNRPPKLSSARAFITEKYGAELAQALLVENPRAAVESRPLPYFPEPTPPPKRKRRFWFF
jgi:protein-tyrosine phosphatase